jgi:hypothetical protein
MKNIISSGIMAVTLVGSLLSGFEIQAREDQKLSGRKAGSPSRQYKADAADCVSPSAQFDLDINNVRARLLTGGDLWWDFANARYEVPKANPPGSAPPLTALFAGSIWISGFDDGGNLKVAAQRFRGSGDDFWPGPVDANGNVSKAVCDRFDRHFNVFGSEIQAAQAAFIASGQVGVDASILSENMLKWPARGNSVLEREGIVIRENLAPFFDFDGNGLYDPTKGDYPTIYGSSARCGESNAYADQMVFWVLNDVGNNHSETNGLALGVQVNTLAFAFQTTDEINNMTFYKYSIINKSPTPITETYISQWADPDLGNFSNDRVGCDTARALGIIYNGTLVDADANGVSGYGTQLPILGIDFFEGPIDTSGIQLGLSSFVYFTNGATVSQSDPSSAVQYRNYQTGFWNDATPFTQGGTGYGGTIPTKFIFPGNPSDLTQWSECQVASTLPAADRRFVQTSGPFTMLPGEANAQDVTLGVVFVRPPGCGVCSACPSFENYIGIADDKAQALFDQCFKLLDGPDAPTLVIRELENEVIINLVNLPGSNNQNESYDQVSAEISALFPTGGVDTTYTFEGYKIYQVANSSVAATDLDDNDKARLIAQVDVKNGIGKLVNFVRDATLQLDIPMMMVEGAEKGITNSFRVTADLFASGQNTRLVNHKTYYYTAIAYAYNNFQPYDQNNPQAGGQKKPFLQGRSNFKVYSAIPNSLASINDGTVLRSQWGDGIEVKRIEGKGNGGNVLFLTPASVQAILDRNFSDTITYEKGADPIGFKVVDPLSIVEADFEVVMVDTSSMGMEVGAGTTWLLKDLTNNRIISSHRDLSRPYEQIIQYSDTSVTPSKLVNYGFSLKMGNPDHIYRNVSNNRAKIYGTLTDSLYFENSVDRWLSFIQDQGTNSVLNWVRSGTSKVAADNAQFRVFDDNWYQQTAGTGSELFADTNEVFESMLNGRWAPYCLTPNFANKAPTNPATPPYVYGPGFVWRRYGQQFPPENNLEKLASVDIVITPDKSKWSRCVVFETGEDEGVNKGSELAPNRQNARKGQIRMAYSWDKDNRYHDGSNALPADTGRSWFPGYAINVETGERLNICFGENSEQGDQNGRDMIWNPTGTIFGPLTFPGQTIDRIPVLGGKHFIYVMESRYDEGASMQRTLIDNYNIGSNNLVPTPVRDLFRTILYTSMPYISTGYKLKTPEEGLVPGEVKVHLRVQRPFDRMFTNSTFIDSLPRYQFSTKGMGALVNQGDVVKSACDKIRVVPNPYYSYSEYEVSQLDNRIKVTNLPNKCTVTIYALDGTIIRVLRRSIGVDPSTLDKIDVNQGSASDRVNLENALEWDLKNEKGVPVSSGVYLFYVDAPGVCQKTVKWFGIMRPTDVSNF